MTTTQTGRELDARVAVEVMGLDVRGAAVAVFIDGEWSIHPDTDPEKWLCHAGEEPVYLPADMGPGNPPKLEDELRLMAHGYSREDCEASYAEQLEEWNRDIERWGCTHYVLEVVPRYTTDPAADLAVLEHVRETWDHERRWAFARVLVEVIWRERGTTRLPPAMRYEVGDYSRAALAVIDGRAW